MKSLIIGNGQVGSSLYKVLKDYHETYVKDIEDLELKDVEVLHLCYPYNDKFIETANSYIAKYQPKLTINHSSVPVGTTENISGNVVYSPIRGKHPNLDKGIRQFHKFVAGKKDDVNLAYKYFTEAKIDTLTYDETKIRSLEFSKLMTNIRYGYEICFMQEADRIAEHLGADMEIFKMFEATYNIGYKILGEDHMIRPNLYGGYIGGHCVIHNCDIISSQHPSEMIDWILFSNCKKRVELEKREEK